MLYAITYHSLSTPSPFLTLSSPPLLLPHSLLSTHHPLLSTPSPPSLLPLHPSLYPLHHSPSFTPSSPPVTLSSPPLPLLHSLLSTRHPLLSLPPSLPHMLRPLPSGVPYRVDLHGSTPNTAMMANLTSFMTEQGERSAEVRPHLLQATECDILNNLCDSMHKLLVQGIEASIRVHTAVAESANWKYASNKSVC